MAGQPPGRDDPMTINLRSWADVRIPPIRSPSWERIVPPLFDYLSSARTIDEIVEWGAIEGHSHGMINNMLAYLSLAGRIRHDGASACWVRGGDRQIFLAPHGDHRAAGMGR